jgi:hypothetical protein
VAVEGGLGDASGVGDLVDRDRVERAVLVEQAPTRVEDTRLTRHSSQFSLSRGDALSIPEPGVCGRSMNLSTVKRSVILSAHAAAAAGVDHHDGSLRIPSRGEFGSFKAPKYGTQAVHATPIKP